MNIVKGCDPSGQTTEGLRHSPRDHEGENNIAFLAEVGMGFPLWPFLAEGAPRTRDSKGGNQGGGVAALPLPPWCFRSLVSSPSAARKKRQIKKGMKSTPVDPMPLLASTILHSLPFPLSRMIFLVRFLQVGNRHRRVNLRRGQTGMAQKLLDVP